MTRQPPNLSDHSIPVPITSIAEQTSLQFARACRDPAKAEQVRLNTLAVYAVHHYLDWLEIATDLTVCDSWDPLMRLFCDVADLEVLGIGRLECRPVDLRQQPWEIPLEAWEDRIGYVMVALDETERTARLLGFYPTASETGISLTTLQPIEALLTRLQPAPTPTPVPASSPTVHLEQWLRNQFEEGWEAIETLFQTGFLGPRLAFRGESQVSELPADFTTGKSRGRVIDLGIQFGEQRIVLVVTFLPLAEGDSIVRLQLRPTGDQLYLPFGLRFQVRDQQGILHQDLQTRSADNRLQLELTGQQGEEFSVEIKLGEFRLTQAFVI